MSNGLIKGGHLDTETETLQREHHIKVKAENRLMNLQTKKGQELPGSQTCDLQNWQTITFSCFSQPVCATRRSSPSPLIQWAIREDNKDSIKTGGSWLAIRLRQCSQWEWKLLVENMFCEEGCEKVFFKLYLWQIRLEWVENPILNKQNTCLKLV